MFINCFEIALAALLQYNSLVYFDLSSTLSLVISMALSYMVCSAGRLIIAFKRKLLLIYLIIATSLLFTKLSLILLNKVVIKNMSTNQVSWHTSFGFKYDDLNQTIDSLSSIRQEIVGLIIVLVYFLFLEKQLRALQGRDRIHRTLTRIVPITRQRVLHHEINANPSNTER